jgi:hypothetical protein
LLEQEFLGFGESLFFGSGRFYMRGRSGCFDQWFSEAGPSTCEGEAAPSASEEYYRTELFIIFSNMKRLIELYKRWRRGEEITFEGEIGIPLPLIIGVVIIIIWGLVKLMF